MNERNIKWWENVKRGDKLEMDVDSNEPNAWVFSNKKNTDVFFDEISYPPESLRNIAEPAPKFQRNKEDLGKSNRGYLLRLENLKRIKTINGEPIKKMKTHKTNAVKTKSESPGKFIPSGEVYQVNGRWVCPCYNPDFPDRFSYSQKGHAVWNHKKHILQS
jgi:hypothetical protein